MLSFTTVTLSAFTTVTLSAFTTVTLSAFTTVTLSVFTTVTLSAFTTVTLSAAKGLGAGWKPFQTQVFPFGINRTDKRYLLPPDPSFDFFLAGNGRINIRRLLVVDKSR